MIANDKVVTFKYELKDDAGELLDESGDETMTYLHGGHGIVPGLEKAMTGKKPGDKFKAVLAPADAYGELVEDSQVTAPRSAFPDDVDIEPGLVVMLEDDEGEEMPVWVIEVGEDGVLLDRNHPLAGVTLHFSIEVVAVRDATREEKTHGHVHGPGGHHD